MSKMLPISSILFVLILIYSFQSGLRCLLASDDIDDRVSAPEERNSEHRGPCWNLRDKPNLYFQAFDREYWVALRPQESVLNPHQPVRTYKGFGFHQAAEGHPFAPCLVRGSATADGTSVEVYGNILNGSFSGFALIGGKVHHIRRAGLERAKRDLHFLRSDAYPSLFASGREPESGGNLTETLMARHQKKKWSDPGPLYAKDCPLKLIADHTFERSVGGGDSGIARSFMTHFVQEADALFRVADVDGNHRPDLLGFRVHDIKVFEDFALPADYPLHDETLSSDALLARAAASYKDPASCYVLVFVYRSFADNSLAKGHAWNAAKGQAKGGVCSAAPEHGGLPNVGFVSLRLGDRRLSHRVATMAVARVLAAAFGARIEAGTTSCPVLAGTDSVTSGFFPPPDNVWDTVNGTLSWCAVRDMKPVLEQRAGCFVSVLPQRQEASGPDYDYYDVSAAEDRGPRPFGLLAAATGLWLAGNR